MKWHIELVRTVTKRTWVEVTAGANQRHRAERLAMAKAAGIAPAQWAREVGQVEVETAAPPNYALGQARRQEWAREIAAAAKPRLCRE